MSNSTSSSLSFPRLSFLYRILPNPFTTDVNSPSGGLNVSNASVVVEPSDIETLSNTNNNSLLTLSGLANAFKHPVTFFESWLEQEEIAYDSERSSRLEGMNQGGTVLAGEENGAGNDELKTVLDSTTISFFWSGYFWTLMGLAVLINRIQNVVPPRRAIANNQRHTNNARPFSNILGLQNGRLSPWGKLLIRLPSLLLLFRAILGLVGALGMAHYKWRWGAEDEEMEMGLMSGVGVGGVGDVSGGEGVDLESWNGVGGGRGDTLIFPGNDTVIERFIVNATDWEPFDTTTTNRNASLAFFPFSIFLTSFNYTLPLGFHFQWPSPFLNLNHSSFASRLSSYLPRIPLPTFLTSRIPTTTLRFLPFSLPPLSHLTPLHLLSLILPSLPNYKSLLTLLHHISPLTHLRFGSEAYSSLFGGSGGIGDDDSSHARLVWWIFVAICAAVGTESFVRALEDDLGGMASFNLSSFSFLLYSFSKRPHGHHLKWSQAFSGPGSSSPPTTSTAGAAANSTAPSPSPASSPSAILSAAVSAVAASAAAAANTSSASLLGAFDNHHDVPIENVVAESSFPSSSSDTTSSVTSGTDEAFYLGLPSDMHLFLVLILLEIFTLHIFSCFHPTHLGPYRLWTTAFFNILYQVLAIRSWFYPYVYSMASRPVLEMAFEIFIFVTVSLRVLAIFIREGRDGLGWEEIFGHPTHWPSRNEDFLTGLIKYATSCLQTTQLTGLANEVDAISAPPGPYVELNRSSRSGHESGQVSYQSPLLSSPSSSTIPPRTLVQTSGLQNEVTDVRAVPRNEGEIDGITPSPAVTLELRKFFGIVWGIMKAHAKRARRQWRQLKRGLELPGWEVEVLEDEWKVGDNNNAVGENGGGPGTSSRIQKEQEARVLIARNEEGREERVNDDFPQEDDGPIHETEYTTESESEEGSFIESDFEDSREAQAIRETNGMIASTSAIPIEEMTTSSRPPQPSIAVNPVAIPLPPSRQKLRRRRVLSTTTPAAVARDPPPRSPEHESNPSGPASAEEDFVQKRRNAAMQEQETKSKEWWEERKAELERLNMCVICTCEKRNIVCWPCRCLALCDECRENMAEQMATSLCPCCRTPVKGFSRIFLP